MNKESASKTAGHPPIRAIVVDDVAPLRQSIADYLVRTGKFEVIGQAANGADGVKLARKTLPDLVLIDIHMPVMDGIEATRLLKAMPDAPRVIAVSLADDRTVQAVLDAGADAFCDKQDLFGSLIQRILKFFPTGGRTRPEGA